MPLVWVNTSCTERIISENSQQKSLLWARKLLILSDDSSLSIVTMPQKPKKFPNQEARKAFFVELRRRQAAQKNSNPWVLIPKH